MMYFWLIGVFVFVDSLDLTFKSVVVVYSLITILGAVIIGLIGNQATTGNEIDS
jgi:hypothetical protein